MLLYIMVYTANCILLLSDKFRKGLVKSMNIGREFAVFENDMDWRTRKRLQLLEADDFRGVKFRRLDG